MIIQYDMVFWGSCLFYIRVKRLDIDPLNDLCRCRKSDIMGLLLFTLLASGGLGIAVMKGSFVFMGVTADKPIF